MVDVVVEGILNHVTAEGLDGACESEGQCYAQILMCETLMPGSELSDIGTWPCPTGVASAYRVG